jgi:hypothetical protein
MRQRVTSVYKRCENRILKEYVDIKQMKRKEKLHKSYSSRKMIWAEHAARMVNMGNAYKVLAGNSEGN